MRGAIPTGGFQFIVFGLLSLAIFPVQTRVVEVRTKIDSVWMITKGLEAGEKVV